MIEIARLKCQAGAAVLELVGRPGTEPINAVCQGEIRDAPREALCRFSFQLTSDPHLMPGPLGSWAGTTGAGT